MDRAMGSGAVHHGGRLLVEQLARNGVRRAFCIPGESYLAVLDGLVGSGIDLVVCRHESGASMMAEAHGKFTGEPGVAFVTRGPGATNASPGVHVAMQDSTPMILFVGQVARSQRDREAFQEVDYRAMYGPLAKWVAEIDVTARIPEYVNRAFSVALSGRPGPVVLALPEDMLSAETETLPAPAANPSLAGVDERHVDEIVALLEASQRPLVMAGGGGWSAEAAVSLQRFAEAFDLPVCVSFRCQDYLDNHSPHYVGDAGVGISPKLGERIKAADLLLALGPRLGEATTSGYTLLTPPAPVQRLIHVHPDGNEIGSVYGAALGVAAPAAAVVEALAGRRPGRAYPWAGWRAAARADYDDWQVAQETPGALKLEGVITALNTLLSDDAVVTNGAGNYAAWLHRYYRFARFRTQLAPTSGSMGYGLPAAVAAKLEAPTRDVVCLAGDGCFQMTMQEFGTAAEKGAAIIVLIANNGMYGTIRMHQEKHYPGRVCGTSLKNPEFAALAWAYGGHGETVERTEDFEAAFERARSAGVPAILDLRMDQTALSPRLTLKETVSR